MIHRASRMNQFSQKTATRSVDAQPPMSKLFKRLVFGVAIALTLSGSTFTPVIAQESRPDTSSAPEQRPAVRRLVPDQWLLPSTGIDGAPIYLDGRTLFQVSAPAVAGRRPAEDRAQQIQRQLNGITREIDAPPKVEVSIDQPSNLPVIEVNDQMLLTATNLDAQLSGYASPNLLALTLAENLRTAFDRYFLERSPAFLQRQLKIAVGILLGAALLQLAAMRLAQRLKRRQIRLMNAKTKLGSERSPRPIVAVPATLALNSVYEQFKARLDNYQKRKLNEMESGLLTFFQAALWARRAAMDTVSISL